MHRSMERRELSRELRQRQTSAEERFWDLVRGRRFEGLKFRRQHPIGQFIADFYCPELELAVEVDGAVHGEPVQSERDLARDEMMTHYGVRVIRIKNEDLLDRPAETLERLKEQLPQESASPPASPPPLHVRGEGARR